MAIRRALREISFVAKANGHDLASASVETRVRQILRNWRNGTTARNTFKDLGKEASKKAMETMGGSAGWILAQVTGYAFTQVFDKTWQRNESAIDFATAEFMEA